MFGSCVVAVYLGLVSKSNKKPLEYNRGDSFLYKKTTPESSCICEKTSVKLHLPVESLSI